MSITQARDVDDDELPPAKPVDGAGPTANGNRRRLAQKKTTINLPPALLEKLEAVQEEIGAASVSEVFRNALKLYLHLHEESKAGNAVMTIDPAGNRTSYQLHLG